MAEVQIIAVDKVQAQRIGDVNSPRLHRNELTRDAKRNQLASLGVRGAEADKVLNDLYGAEWEATQTAAVDRFCELARDAHP